MSETESETPVTTVAQPADHPDDGPSASSATRGVLSPDRDVQAYLHWGALAGFVLLAVAATMQLYASGTRAIRIWVAPDFVPIFVGAFNLVVLLVAVLGISWVGQRMKDS